MAHRLNTNKQFMIGNGILAFAVLFVVALFVYITLQAQRDQDDSKRYFNETYTINLVRGFQGDSLSLYMNDSLLINSRIAQEPFTLEVARFAEQSTLLIVDNATDLLSTFELSERGGAYSFVKDADGVKQLAR